MAPLPVPPVPEAAGEPFAHAGRCEPVALLLRESDGPAKRRLLVVGPSGKSRDVCFCEGDHGPHGQEVGLLHPLDRRADFGGCILVHAAAREDQGADRASASDRLPAGPGRGFPARPAKIRARTARARATGSKSSSAAISRTSSAISSASSSSPSTTSA